MSKNKLIFLLLFPFLFSCSQGFLSHKKNKKILFVGNSITYTNNLPSLINYFSKSYFDTYYSSDMLAFGGATVSDHMKDGVIESLLSKQNYDYLVLQEKGGDVLCLPNGLKNEPCRKVYDSHIAISKIAKKHNVAIIYLGTYQPIKQVSESLVSSEQYISKQISASYVEVSESLRKLKNKEPNLSWLHEDKGHPGNALTFLMAMKILKATEGPVPHVDMDICTSYTRFSPKLKKHKFITQEELLKSSSLNICWLSLNEANSIINFINFN